MDRFEVLRSARVDVVIDTSGGVPAVGYWGSPLGLIGSDLGGVFDEPSVPGSLDVSRRIPLVPVHGDGFPGRPGLAGHRRGGRHWSPRFVMRESTVRSDGDESVLECRCDDSVAELSLHSHFRLDSDGVLTTSVSISNEGDSPYMIDALTASIMFPSHATHLGTFTGRWAREFHLNRFEWMQGAWTAENRSGRSSHEHPPFVWVFAGQASEEAGEVWSLHTAWSGDHVVYAEYLSDGRRYVQVGELFHPGEMCLDPGEHLSTPNIIGVYSAHGLTEASRTYHRFVRRVSPVAARPRLVHLNTWEAVYFDHDLDKLKELARVGADVGVERFVLDDGWFGHRRDDTRGLGDWYVSPDVYPEGLGPLIDHVHALGMDFGIWVEPEMANLDSEIVRDHPDWVLATAGYVPVLGRHQVVLDLSRPDVIDHLFERLHRLLSDNAIAYVKWDMNRPLVQASNVHGKASNHQQVRAVYRLLDRLRESHPAVEFESCASGGGRIDFEMLRRVERVWTSDNNDARERQFIVRGASMMLPLSVLGSHIGPSPSHTTRRRHSLSFRGATALFGHLGIEADLTSLDERDLGDVTRVVAVYKQFRELVHSGNLFRIDSSMRSSTGSPTQRDQPVLVHGVVSQDSRQALVSIAQLDTETSLVPARVRIPGLVPDARYQVQLVPLTENQRDGQRLGPAIDQPGWISASVAGRPVSITGRVLSAIGLQRPVMWPESAIVVHLSGA